MFTNNNEIDFEFTVSREDKVMALVEFKRNAIYFNKQWRLKANVLANLFMDAPPDIVPSDILNFEIGTFGSGRFDVKFDKKEFVALLCTHRNLYSVRFNCDNAIKRFREYIDREDERRPLDIVRVKEFLEINGDAKLRVVREFVIDSLRSKRNVHGAQQFDADGMVQQFVRPCHPIISLLVNRRFFFIFELKNNKKRD